MKRRGCWCSPACLAQNSFGCCVTCMFSFTEFISMHWGEKCERSRRSRRAGQSALSSSPCVYVPTWASWRTDATPYAFVTPMHLTTPEELLVFSDVCFSYSKAPTWVSYFMWCTNEGLKRPPHLYWRSTGKAGSLVLCPQGVCYLMTK